MKAEENRVIVKNMAEGKLIPARDEIHEFLGFENILDVNYYIFVTYGCVVESLLDR